MEPQRLDDPASDGAEQRHRISAETLPVMIWAARADGGLDWVNARTSCFTGLSLADQVAGGWAAVIHPDELSRFSAGWRAGIGSSAEFELEHRLRGHDGLYRWHLMRATPAMASTGAVERWVGVTIDIERQNGSIETLAKDNAQLEQDIFTQLHEVKRTRTRLEAFFDACPDYLYLMRLSKDGLFYDEVNPAAAALYDIDRAGIVGQRPVDIVDAATAADIERYARQILRTGTPVDYQTERKFGSGPAVSIQVVGAPIDFHSADEGLVLFCGRDITAQRVAEEALRQSQKMEAVGQLTGGLAHDFNNLLTGITGSLDLLQLRVSQGRFDRVERYIKAAQGAAERAAALTHRLLAFSRRQTLDPQTLDANALVAGMVDLLRRTVGPEIDLEVVAAPALWTILADPSQLENALLNLCINARDAMPNGGRITIETANRRLTNRQADERGLASGDYVVVSVTDNGTGIEAHVLERIFDPFFTTKPIGLGTGLGLSMIYGFARQSGGQVRVHSKLGMGTTLRIILPRHDGEPDAQVSKPDLSSAPRATGDEAVLIVDDESTVRMLVLEVLQDLGYTAIEAVDGAAGLRLLRSSVRIDLLVTDVGLPGGLNGRQLAEAGRALRPGLKTLFITGYAENAVLNHGHLEPGMHILTKPFAMEELASRIKTLIAEP